MWDICFLGFAVEDLGFTVSRPQGLFIGSRDFWV